jgi:uncharacterized protein YbaA (DUF1428 family)
MAYVNAFAAAVPSANKTKYLDMANKMDAYFKAKGATRIVECWGNDIPDGKLTSFPLAVKKEDGETVVFGWIEWPSKAMSDTVMGAMMSDPEMAAVQMPFDGKRMIYGGFDVILEM